MTWFTYILKCSDNTLYTGVTIDLKRRLSEHNGSSKGAKYTRTRRPVEMIYNEECIDRSHACKREYNIKKLTRTKKLRLINGT